MAHTKWLKSTTGIRLPNTRCQERTCSQIACSFSLLLLLTVNLTVAHYLSYLDTNFSRFELTGAHSSAVVCGIDSLESLAILCCEKPWSLFN